MLTPESWPTDPQQCHDLLGQFAQQVEDLRAALEEAAKLHDQTIQEGDQLVEELRRQIELYRRYVFGPRRERIADAPGRGRLFDSDAIDGVALRSTATTAAGSGTPNSDSATFRPASKRWPASITRSTIFPLRLRRLL
jgi:hypothetical protein